MDGKKKLIKIIKNKITWENAICEGVELLVKNDIATSQLANAIIESTKKLGPYYILAPRFALAHVSPGNYNKKIGLSIILFRESVWFSNDQKHEVNLLFTLSAVDNSSHVNLLAKIANLFNNLSIVDQALECKNEEELFKLFKEVI